MGAIIIFLLFTCIGAEISGDNRGLIEKLKQSKERIAKFHVQEPPTVEIKSYKIQWDKIWNEQLGKKRPFIINKFDKIFLLEDNRLLAISTNASNEFSFRKVAQIDRDDSIKFVRSFAWKSVLYILICYETSSCSLYTATDNLQLKHRQTVQHRGFPMDASFFTRANQLYLVVADNSGQFTVPSVIYHWRGTYMDVVEEIMTTAAVSVTTFKDKQSTIIVFAQNDKNTPRVGSVVYEFKGTSSERIEFLSTFSPISVHHYNHKGFSFIFMMNEAEPSNIFFWDGKELLNWTETSDIRAPSLIQTANINDETYFLVGQANLLHLYKFQRATDCINLGSLKLEDGARAIDVHVRVHESTVFVFMIVMYDNEVYSAESWELNIREFPHVDSSRETVPPSQCLTELIDALQKRMPIVKDAESSSASLLSATENLTISDPVALPELIIESGTVENIDLSVTEEIVTPEKMNETFKELVQEIENLSSASKNILQLNKTNFLTGDVVIQGDAFFEELQIDSLNVDVFVNTDQSRVVVYPNDTEEFDTPLRGDTIIIHDLEVDSLCGIPSEYWALRNDTSKMMLNIPENGTSFFNGTIYVPSNVSLQSLNVKTLNYENVDEFFRELFILNRDQSIRGNITFKNTLSIADLTLKTLNGELMENYMTKTTDQSFDQFFIKALRVDKLYADLINGVPVSEAARISQKNVIRGEVKLAKLHVTEELIVDSALQLPKVQSLQVYNNVTIHGNVRVKNIDVENNAAVYLNDEKIDLRQIHATHWTKSTDQVIKDKITFNGYLTIDRLDAEYLNGFSDNEFLYTTVKEIPKNFQNLHFENVHVDDSFFVEGENASFFNVATESLMIRDGLHVEHLRANDLLVDVFNGVPVDDILNGESSIVFSKNMSFSTIRAKQVNVDDLDLQFLNDENILLLLEDGKSDKDRAGDILETIEFNVDDLVVERINGLEIKRLQLLNNLRDCELKNLVIDGNLTVKSSMEINKIDDKSPKVYLENVTTEDIVIQSEQTIVDLTVQNLTLNFLNGHEVHRLFENTLSKTREQVVPGKFSFYKITVDNIDTKYINDQDVSKLMWIDEPLMFSGNVTFNDLFVEGDIATTKLNDYDINQMHENVFNIPVKRIANLEVDGNISWKRPSQDSNSLTFLFENAVTKNTDQTIYGETTFENNILVSSMISESKEIDEIRGIVSDAVIDDDGKIIEVTGKKIFKENLTINSLSVGGDINVTFINGLNILEFNNSVVRKYEESMITSPITFLDEVTINNLFINDTVHGVSISKLALANDTLPSNVLFENLIVLGDVYLQNLDGRDFDQFVMDRVTLDGNSDIFPEVQFNGRVEVTGNATTGRINGINPFDLVLNGSQDTQFISGAKIVEQDLFVDGNIHVPLINNVNVTKEYSNGVMNDDNVEIFGDLIFESQVKVTKNVTVLGTINGMNLHTVHDDLEEETHRILRTLKQQETMIEENIVQTDLLSKTLRNVFAYLEAEKKLQIEAPNIKKVNVVYYEGSMKLNMFGEESGSACGLPDDCPCPTGYEAVLQTNGCHVWRTNGTTVVRNFHELNSAFGINVKTNAVSSSQKCSLKGVREEFTTISWMKLGVSETGDTIGVVTEETDYIQGFLKDAEVFMHNNEAYVVLAIYYDQLKATHRTDSLIYKINLANNKLSLHQKIFTDGASSIQIFRINHRQPGTYLVIGCSGDSSRSLLYKLDPIANKFELLRNFSGKSQYVKSLAQDKEHFVLLDSFDTNAVNIFHYDDEFDNFYSYQSLFHDSRVNGIECFYADEFGHSDSFVIVTTEDGQFYIYEYMFAQKFRVKAHHWVDDLQTMMPFYYSGHRYIFTGSSKNSTVLRIVLQGPH